MRVRTREDIGRYVATYRDTEKGSNSEEKPEKKWYSFIRNHQITWRTYGSRGTDLWKQSWNDQLAKTQQKSRLWWHVFVIKHPLTCNAREQTSSHQKQRWCQPPLLMKRHLPLLVETDSRTADDRRRTEPLSGIWLYWLGPVVQWRAFNSRPTSIKCC